MSFIFDIATLAAIAFALIAAVGSVWAFRRGPRDERADNVAAPEMGE